MGVGHGHAHGPAPDLEVRRTPRVVVVALIVLCGLAAVAGVLHWWPDASRADRVRGLVPFTAKGIEVVHADLTRVRAACGAKPAAGCGESAARVLDGRAAGTTVSLPLSLDVLATGLHTGDRVLLFDSTAVGGAGDGAFSFYRADRGTPMVWLAALFALVVVLVAWRRGVMALISLGFALVVVVVFLLPALLSGQPAVPVTVVAATLILIVMLYATHGFSMRTSVALLSALVGVALSTGIAWFAIVGARLGGLGDESSSLLVFNVPWIDVQQLLVASVILAGLGTLNDVTITQVSALWELREASPTMSRPRLFGSAMRIGRDHVASSVYTLVFAYLGTALVLLVAVQLSAGTPVDFATSEEVAEEIVRALVGGVALGLAMPIATAIGIVVIAGAAPSYAEPEPRLPDPEPVRFAGLDADDPWLRAGGFPSGGWRDEG